MTTNTGDAVSYYGMTDKDREDVPERIRDYDWFEAFGYAPFAITDVAEVILAADGCNDEDNWVGVFRLKDGRFGYVSAGCDYTGWDCQAGGAGCTRDTLEEILLECCEDDDRRRFGLKSAKAEAK